MNRSKVYLKFLGCNCLIIILMISLGGCKETRNSKSEVYLQDSKISDQKGNPKDSSVYFLPMDMNFKDSEINNGLDPFMSKWMSSMLYFLNEPVLYNSYLGKDIFRLLYLDNRPVVISMVSDHGKITLTTKVLNHALDPNKPGKHISFYRSFDNKKTTKDGDLYYGYEVNDIELQPLKIILNRTKVLSAQEWDTFNAKLDSINYYNMEPTDESGMNYGPRKDIVLESHSKEKYWMVHRKSFDYNLIRCCSYLLELSNIKDDGIITSIN
ncbi:MAG: hypothetical protein ACM3QX_17915 [Syntrophomonadaceae bacterium]